MALGVKTISDLIFIGFKVLDIENLEDDDLKMTLIFYRTFSHHGHM